MQPGCWEIHGALLRCRVFIAKQLALQLGLLICLQAFLMVGRKD